MMAESEPARFDVIATNVRTLERRLIASGKTERDAGAIVKFAVMRRGVEDEFFTAEPRS